LPRFVVHQHFATHVHFDFRLEVEGVLRSWAVPKGPSADTHDKRLAVRVEDHPLEYIDFQGEIPEGQYGAGRVEIWDSGEYEMIEESEGFMRFRLQGERLRGTWKLIRMRWKPGDNWLLQAGRDAEMIGDRDDD